VPGSGIGCDGASERRRAVRVRVEATKCEGYGNCAAHLPEVFVLDEWGYASVNADGNVAPEDEGRARRAVLDCPAHAILEEGDSDAA
jgi:ferredoxin